MAPLQKFLNAVLDKYKNISLFQTDQFKIFAFTLLISTILYHDYIFGDKIFVFVDIGSDTYAAYFPLIKLAGELLKDFSTYTFHWGIGNDLFKIGFLYDIFNWPLFFLEDETLLKSLVYIMILKHLLASQLFYRFIQYYNFCSLANIITSIYFAFIATMIIWGQHYQFSSGIIYFMFALFTFERYINEKKYFLFIISVAMMLMFSVITFSFYFFIFLLFYASLRYIYLYGFTGIIRFSLQSFFFVSISFLIAAFLFLPNVYNIVSSPRVSATFLDNLSFFKLLPFGENHFFTSILRFFSNDILGVGSESHRVVLPYLNFYEMANLYSGLLTLLLIPLIFFAKLTKKNLLTIFIPGLLTYLFFNNEIFVLLMSGYSKSFEFRYGFIFSIVLLIGLGKILNDNINTATSSNKMLFSFILLAIIFTFSIYYGISYKHWNINSTRIITFFILFIIFSTLYILILSNSLSIQRKSFILTTIMALEIIFFSYNSINDRGMLRKNTIETKFGYYDGTAKAIGYINSINNDAFYRVFKYYKSYFRNDSIIQGYNGLDVYSSLVDPNYRALFTKFLTDTKSYPQNQIWSKKDLFYLNSLLCTKYFLSKEKLPENSDLKFIQKIGHIFVYQNLATIPFGALYSNTILEHEAPTDPTSLQESIYHNIILPNPIEGSTQEPTVSTAKTTLPYSSQLVIASFRNDRIEGTLQAREAGIILFQIPYNKGWSLHINGEEHPLEKIDYGLMGTSITKGDHYITLTYTNPTLKYGLLLSLIGLILFLVLYIFRKKVAAQK